MSIQVELPKGTRIVYNFSGEICEYVSHYRALNLAFNSKQQNNKNTTEQPSGALNSSPEQN